jgi:hypothetical protein
VCQRFEVFYHQNYRDVLKRVKALLRTSILELEVPLRHHDHLAFQGAKAEMRVVFAEVVDTFFCKLSFEEVVPIT